MTFDDLTLLEVDQLQATCLGGMNMSDDGVDYMKLAGGVMWLFQKRAEPDLTWPDFMARTQMGDIKAFSEQMELEEQVDPTVLAPPTVDVPGLS
jgi:hypothetical protein